MANLYDMLKEDHNNVKQMLDQTIRSKDPSQFPKIKKELEVHMMGEEKFFYPKIMEQDKETALESFEEHHVSKMVLKELESTNESDEVWMPKVKVLKDIVEHHIEEEESEIFLDAQDMMDRNEEEQIARQIEEFKQEKM
ncbi:MAG: hemerythrin domain-containing protein [Methanobacterium sp.]